MNGANSPAVPKPTETGEGAADGSEPASASGDQSGLGASVGSDKDERAKTSSQKEDVDSDSADDEDVDADSADDEDLDADSADDEDLDDDEYETAVDELQRKRERLLLKISRAEPTRSQIQYGIVIIGLLSLPVEAAKLEDIIAVLPILKTLTLGPIGLVSAIWGFTLVLLGAAYWLTPPRTTNL